jgi:hypothetical protein
LHFEKSDSNYLILPNINIQVLKKKNKLIHYFVKIFIKNSIKNLIKFEKITTFKTQFKHNFYFKHLISFFNF